jgi:hypothetical protein
MSNTSLVPVPASRRLRAASPALHGGASSMLRLARGSDTRLPSGAALSGWAERAAAMLDLTPMMVGPRAPELFEAAPRVVELPLHDEAHGVDA